MKRHLLLSVKPKPSSVGFTIVELLIVIVVIGILATITIVAYNGIQQRARNVKTLSAAQNYRDLLAIYANDHDGKYPSLAPPDFSTTTYFACLGEDYPSNKCYGNYPENAELNTMLKEYTDTLPMPSIPASRQNSGVLYVPESASAVNNVYKIDGNTTAWLTYVLDADSTDVTCSVGPVASFNGATFSATPPSNGQTTAGSSTSNPTCWTPLPK